MLHIFYRYMDNDTAVTNELVEFVRCPLFLLVLPTPHLPRVPVASAPRRVARDTHHSPVPLTFHLSFALYSRSFSADLPLRPRTCMRQSWQATELRGCELVHALDLFRQLNA